MDSLASQAKEGCACAVQEQYSSCQRRPQRPGRHQWTYHRAAMRACMSSRLVTHTWPVALQCNKFQHAARRLSKLSMLFDCVCFAWRRRLFLQQNSLKAIVKMQFAF